MKLNQEPDDVYMLVFAYMTGADSRPARWLTAKETRRTVPPLARWAEEEDQRTPPAASGSTEMQDRLKTTVSGADKKNR